MSDDWKDKVLKSKQQEKSLLKEQMQRSFHCHIDGCGKKTENFSEARDRGLLHVLASGGMGPYLPNDLWMCDRCYKWTCKKHIYLGVCSACAQKL